MSERAFYLGLALGVFATAVGVLALWELDLWLRSRVKRPGYVGPFRRRA